MHVTAWRVSRRTCYVVAGLVVDVVVYIVRLGGLSHGAKCTTTSRAVIARPLGHH